MSIAPITYATQSWSLGGAHGQTFRCGNSFTGLSVIVFSGPNNARIAAFCCNPNIDIDGDPQAYGRHDNPRKIPSDSLQDGGWLNPAQNAAAKSDFLQLPTDLPQWKAELAALPANVDANTKKLLTDKIAKGERRLAQLTRPQKHDSSLPGHPKLDAKHLGEKFWDWYGPVALTPDEAAGQRRRVKGETEDRAPRLAKEYSDGDQFEDLYGRYPVIQSGHEPGREFFVSALATPVNTDFPVWDQRSTLAPGAIKVGPYMALSNHLKAQPASLALNHHVLGLRLDDGTSVTMKYLDSAANNITVGEISLPAFTALGGTVPDVIFAANTVRNNFLVFYMAVPVTDPADITKTFASFSLAPNANDLPVMLAFIAEETVKATGTLVPGNSKINVTNNPMAAFETWSNAPPSMQFPPSTYDRIRSFLMTLGYVPSSGTAYPTRPVAANARPAARSNSR